eukprot:gene25973-11658_t
MHSAFGPYRSVRKTSRLLVCQVNTTGCKGALVPASAGCTRAMIDLNANSVSSAGSGMGLETIQERILNTYSVQARVAKCPVEKRFLLHAAPMTPNVLPPLFTQVAKCPVEKRFLLHAAPMTPNVLPPYSLSPHDPQRHVPLSKQVAKGHVEKRLLLHAAPMTPNVFLPYSHRWLSILHRSASCFSKPQDLQRSTPLFTQVAKYPLEKRLLLHAAPMTFNVAKWDVEKRLLLQSAPNCLPQAVQRDQIDILAMNAPRCCKIYSPHRICTLWDIIYTLWDAKEIWP